MVPSNRGFKYRFGNKAAPRAPMSPPTIVGIRIGTIAGRSRLLCLSKPLTPTTPWSSMDTRLVAFAMSAGRPNTMSAGKVRLEPPPAIVLILPAMNPVTHSRIIPVKSRSIFLIQFRICRGAFSHSSVIVQSLVSSIVVSNCVLLSL